MLFGGSTSSTSVTASASTVDVQVSLRWSSPCGSSTNDEEAPLGVTMRATLPLREHARVNAPEAAFTASPKVTVMLVSVATSIAPFGGVVAATNGAESAEQKCVSVPLLRGLGGPLAKSAPLLSLSWQPPSARESAVVFVVAGAAAAPSK